MELNVVHATSRKPQCGKQGEITSFSLSLLATESPHDSLYHAVEGEIKPKRASSVTSSFIPPPLVLCATLMMQRWEMFGTMNRYTKRRTKANKVAPCSNLSPAWPGTRPRPAAGSSARSLRPDSTAECTPIPTGRQATRLTINVPRAEACYVTASTVTN